MAWSRQVSAPVYVPQSAFIAPLEGLRAVAAFGVMLTHVSFQTGIRPDSPCGAVLTRFDFFVPVFFALSAFLLWRRHGVHHEREDWGRYFRNRAARILPAYLVFVCAVLLLLPEAYGVSWTTALANLTFTQLYVPNALAPGMTHLWSLVVEVAFYLALPLFAISLRRLQSKQRILVIVLLCLLSLGWAFLPFVESSPASGVPNRQIYPPAYMCWFAVGMVAAELEGKWSPRILEKRWLWWILAGVSAWVAAQAWYGPQGLVHPSPWEFVRRVLAGALFAAFIVWPYALRPTRDWLSSPILQALGTWSYSIFLWHLPMLTLAFPLLGISLFDGHFFQILALTTLFTVPVSAASYYFIEDPVRRFVRALSKKPRVQNPHTTEPHQLKQQPTHT